jgi:hypothetical protein
VTGQADEDRRLAMLLQAERLVELEAETVLGQVVELEGDIRPHRPSYIRPPELGP